MPVLPSAPLMLLLRCLLALFAMLPTGLHALGAGDVDELAQRHWTTRDGLPHNSVSSVAQTPDGYLWLATWEGLVRYNGREFLLHGRDRLPALQDMAMRALHLDGEGALWVGGVRGDLLRLADGVWTALPPAPGFVNALLLDTQGRLWVGMETHGLMRIDPDGQRHGYGTGDGLPGMSVFALQQDPGGRIWVAGSGGLARLDGARLEAVPLGGRRGSALGLSLDAQGRLLVATSYGGFRQDAQGGFELLHPDLGGRAFLRIVQMGDGSYWLGGSTDGLVRVRNGELQGYGLAQGLPNGRVLALLEDDESALWVATHGGLVRLWDAPFSSLTEARGLPDNFVRATLATSDGSLWIGTGRGLARWWQGRLQPLPEAALAQQSVLSLAEGADGELLVGTLDRGVLRLRGDREGTQIGPEQGLPSVQVRSLHKTPGGRLWIGTIAGVAALDPGADRVESISAGPAGSFVLGLHEDPRGGLWIGTPEGLDHLPAGAAVPQGVTLPGDTRAIYAIQPRRGVPQQLWLSSDRGLLLLDVHRHEVSLLGPDQGLPLEKIFHVAEDGLGQLWLSSNRGALRLGVDAALQGLRGEVGRVQVDLFDETHGMASSQCNSGAPASTVDAEGNLWVATAVGVARLGADRLASPTARRLPVRIESFRVDGQEQSLAGQTLRLGPGVGRIEATAVGLGFLLPERVHYRFKLDGFDSDWVERGPLYAIEYTNLRPGSYRLRAQAAYVGAPWDASESVLDFVVLPWPWQRPQLQGAALLLALGLLTLGVRLRVRKLARDSLRLREAVAAKTVELRSTAEQLARSDAEKSRLLERIQQQAEAFERQAREDALTGLANRRAFDELLQLELRRTRRSGAPLCLLLMDIDHFKRINDSYGHAAGDQVIQALADCMRRHSRDTDVLSRWGGEEFALLMPATRIEDASVVGERLRSAVVGLQLQEIAPDLSISVSLGLAEAAPGISADDLLVNADAALYQAKREGRNRLQRASG